MTATRVYMVGIADDEQRILAANEAFYAAFAARDVAAMEALWARRAAVACIHPGWQPLRGRDAVLASWRGILTGGGAPPIRCVDAVVHLLGEAAFVLCSEQLPGVELVATNVFVREDGQWKLVHHQAGGVAMPAEPPEPADEDEGGGFLH
jgi:ketosteroid isomerase-like protein